CVTGHVDGSLPTAPALDARAGAGRGQRAGPGSAEARTPPAGRTSERTGKAQRLRDTGSLAFGLAAGNKNGLSQADQRVPSGSVHRHGRASQSDGRAMDKSAECRLCELEPPATGGWAELNREALIRMRKAQAGQSCQLFPLRWDMRIK